MRKLILFFTSLSVILFFTSCLKAGDSSFSGQEEFFYITRQDGLQMAYNGNFAMTSAEIKAKSEINRWYRITWTWSTPNGMAAENANVHNAVTSQVEAVPLGAPLQTGGEVPDPVVPVSYFGAITYFPIAGLFGDYLIVQYGWKKKEGEVVDPQLYLVSPKEGETNSGLTFEFRLRKRGTAASTTEKEVKEEAAIKLSSVREAISFQDEKYKDVQVKINYHKDITGEPASVTFSLRIYKE